MAPSRYWATSGLGLARLELATTCSTRVRRPSIPSATSRRRTSRPTSAWTVPAVFTTGALLAASGASGIEPTSGAHGRAVAGPGGAGRRLGGPAGQLPVAVPLGEGGLDGLGGGRGRTPRAGRAPARLHRRAHLAHGHRHGGTSRDPTDPVSAGPTAVTTP